MGERGGEGNVGDCLVNIHWGEGWAAGIKCDQIVANRRQEGELTTESAEGAGERGELVEGKPEPGKRQGAAPSGSDVRKTQECPGQSLCYLGSAYVRMMLLRMAYMTSSAREWKSSLSMMLARWASAVLTLMLRRLATSLLLLPSARS